MTEQNSQKALRSALFYLEKNDRSAVQVHDYLKKKGFADAEIHAVLDRLLELSYVDDAAYARRFIATHPSSGKLLLSHKLRQKGIDRETAAQALAGLSEESQIENALELLRRKLGADADKESMRKAMQSVLRRGFPYSVVRSAAARYDAEAAEELYDE